MHYDNYRVYKVDVEVLSILHIISHGLLSKTPVLHMIHFAEWENTSQCV